MCLNKKIANVDSSSKVTYHDQNYAVILLEIVVFNSKVIDFMGDVAICLVLNFYD